MSDTANASRWLGASFVAIAFAVFGGALGHDWVLDGALAVRDNPLLAPFEPWRIAQLDWWEGTGRPGGLHRPVSLVSLAGLRALAGGSPALINFANVALHGAVAWLHYVLLLRLLGARPLAQPLAWGAALLALVHPVNAEVVGAQVGLADVLASAFACGAVLVAGGASVLRFAMAALLAALAALSKESGVLVVPLAVLFELCRARAPDTPRPRWARALAWSGLGVALALAARAAVLGSLARPDDPVYAGFTALARAASACAAFASYTLPLLAAPWRQLAVVGHQDVPPADGFGDPRALAGALILVALCALPWLALRRGRRELAFAGWFFVLAWLPTSNLLFSSGAIAASRFLYPGLFTFGLAVALLAEWLWSRGGLARTAAVALACWFAVLFPVVAWRENAAWQSERDRCEAAVARAPDSAYGLVDLATRVQGEDPSRAEMLFAAAAAARMPAIPGAELPPEDALETSFLAHAGVAGLARARGDLELAIIEDRAAESIAGRARAARARLPFREDWTRHHLFVLQRLAAVELERAKALSGEARAEAFAQIERDLDACDGCDPKSSETVRLRALLLHVRGDPAGRARLVEDAWRRRPDDPLLRLLWADELRRAGKVKEALALELDVAAGSFESLDPAKTLAIAREGLASGDAGFAAAARALLERLAKPGLASRAAGAIALEASRLLAESGPRRP